MQYFIVTFAVLMICILAMAIGVVMGRQPLKGSCGGLNRIMGLGCMFCSKEDKEACRKKEA